MVRLYMTRMVLCICMECAKMLLNVVDRGEGRHCRLNHLGNFDKLDFCTHSEKLRNKELSANGLSLITRWESLGMTSWLRHEIVEKVDEGNEEDVDYIEITIVSSNICHKFVR